MAGLIVLLAAAVIVLLAHEAFLQRQIRRLAEQADEFLTLDGQALSYSVRENCIAPLHNAVAELEHQLRLAAQRQKEENQRTSRLIADVSHQFKTPLTSLRLFCEMDDCPHLTEQLSQIDRMERLAYSLLRLERLCADGYDFTFETCDVGVLVQQAWASLRGIAGTRELTVSGAATLRCDEKWLSEAYANLLRNACQHTADGSHICVTLTQTEAVLLCAVEDDGGGVLSEELPHLFDRFYRAQNASQEGAGIGLAIVREILRRHHGTIRAENGKKGLCFHIAIPTTLGYAGMPVKSA